MNIVLLLIFFVVFGVLMYVAFNNSRKRYEKIEKQNASFYKNIEHYAEQENLQVEKVPLYTEAGRKLLYALLPKNLPLTKMHWPEIPFYSDEIENTKRRNWNAYVFTTAPQSSKQKILWLPVYIKADGSLFGVVIVTFSTPSTAHWLSIEPEELLLRRSDVQLEYNAFNSRFNLRGSNRALLTEVLDPEFMSRLQGLPEPNVSVWIQYPLSYVAQKGILTQDFISNLRELSGIFQSRFDKAYPSYPEPAK